MCNTGAEGMNPRQEQDPSIPTTSIDAAGPEYVQIEVGGDEIMEIPTDCDKFLELGTLTSAFPGSHGLKYMAESGHYRTLQFDPTGQKFSPPPGGWSGTKFFLMFNNNTPSIPVVPAGLASSSSQQPGVKRRRMNDEPPSPKKGWDVAVARSRRMMLYFTITKKDADFVEGSVRNCATVVTKTEALTAGHCIPDGLPSTKIFQLYGDGGTTYRCQLKKIFNPAIDLAVLQLVEGTFEHVPNGISMPHNGEEYFVLGYDGDFPNAPLSCFFGRFRNTDIYGSQEYVIGSPGTTDGCSGGGVFSRYGYLYGICVAGKIDYSAVVGTLTHHMNLLSLKFSQPSYSHIVPANISQPYLTMTRKI